MMFATLLSLVCLVYVSDVASAQGDSYGYKPNPRARRGPSGPSPPYAGSGRPTGQATPYPGPAGPSGRDTSYSGPSGSYGTNTPYAGSGRPTGQATPYSGPAGPSGRDTSYSGASGSYGPNTPYSASGKPTGGDISYPGPGGPPGRDTSYSGPSGSYGPNTPYSAPGKPTGGDISYPGPGGPQGRNGPYLDPYRADADLRTLGRQIDSLRNREGQQYDKLDRLINSANDNLDFQNDIENHFRERFVQEQKQQNYRLEMLASKIEMIQKLKNQVKYLNERYNSSRTIVDTEALPVWKTIESDITDLENVDVKISDTVNDLQGQADNINDRITSVLVFTWDNIRYLNTLETNVRGIFEAVNRQRTSRGTAELTAKNPAATIKYTIPFGGAPDAAFVGAIEKHLTRTPPGNNYHYPTGYPAIYWSIMTDLWNDRATVEYRDGSAGGWMVDKITVNGNFIYFPDMEFFKDDLPVIE